MPRKNKNTGPSLSRLVGYLKVAEILPANGSVNIAGAPYSVTALVAEITRVAKPLSDLATAKQLSCRASRTRQRRRPRRERPLRPTSRRR